MINIILFLFFIGCISLVAAMVADNPGSVTMLWMDYQIDTSVAFIIFVVVLLAAFIIVSTLLLRRLITAPSEIWNRRKVNHLKSGISELTYSIAELASSNIDAAEKHVHKVERLIGRSPLTLLLSAQIAKSRGDEVRTQRLLEQLLEHKETEYLAARSLSESASKQENIPKALLLARKAHRLNPRDNNSSMAVISLLVRLRQWNEALAAVQNSKLPRADKKKIRALLQLEYGELLLDENRDEEALRMVSSVISTLPDFPPAVTFAARAYSRNDMRSKAIGLVIKKWKKNQSPQIAAVFNEIVAAEPSDKQQKLRAKLSGNAVDGIWSCKSCGHTQIKWNLHCDSCSSFDSLEWK